MQAIAGEYAGMRGPAMPYSPINVWDVQIGAGQTLNLTVKDGYTTLVAVL